MPPTSAPHQSTTPELAVATAPMWRRLVARLVDVITVGTWVFALSIAHVFIHLQLWSDSVAPQPWGNWFLATVTVVVVYAAYEITFTTKTGATPGKDLLGIQVIDATTGGRPTPTQAVLRWLPLGVVQPVPAVGLAALLTGAIGASGFAHPERRAVHDRLAGTRVVSKEAPVTDEARAERRRHFTPRLVDPTAVFRLARSNPRALHRHPDDTEA